MKHLNRLTLIVLLIATSAVQAAEDGAMMERPSFYASESASINAVVEAIDHETRQVTISRPDGVIVSFTASDNVRNLDQVSVGDVIFVEYDRTISIEVRANEGMQPAEAEMAAVARTEEGEMPGAIAVDSKVITATVEEINIEANTFKLKGPDGNISEYRAQNPENLKRAMVGDLVVITVTDAVAITVEPHVAE